MIKNKFRELSLGNVAIFSGNQVFTKLSLIYCLIFITPFTNGENLFFNFNHTIATMVIVALLFMLNIDTIFNTRKVLDNKLKIFLYLLILSYFCSLVFGLQYTDNSSLTRYSSTFQSSLRSLLTMIPLHLSLIFIIYISIDNLEEIKKILNCFVICSVFVNFVAIFLLLKGLNTISGRIASTFEDPNYLGRLEVISVAISFCFIMFVKMPRFLKMLHFANIFISIIIQVLTFSRSSIITLVAVTFIILFFSKNKILKIMIPSGLVLGMIVIIPIMSAVRYGSASTVDVSFLSTFVDPSNAFRILLNIVGFKMFLDNPLFGIGYNNFYNTMLNNSAYFPVSFPLITNTPILHSWLFNILAEQGFLGFFSFVSILYLLFIKLKLVIKENISGDTHFISIALFSLLFIMVFNGLFFPTIIMELLFSVICGIIAAFLKIIKTKYSYLNPKLSVI